MAWRSEAAPVFDQFLVRIVVELRHAQRRFLLREIGFRGGHVGLGLAYAACGIHFRLLGRQLVLLQLLLVDGNLIAGRFGSGFGAGERGAGLILARR